MTKRGGGNTHRANPDLKLSGLLTTGGKSFGSFELTQARFFPPPEGEVATTGEVGARAGDVLDFGMEEVDERATGPEGRRISREGRGGTETGRANDEGIEDRAAPEELEGSPICVKPKERKSAHERDETG